MAGIIRSQLRRFGASWRQHIENLHHKLFGLQYEEAILFDLVKSDQKQLKQCEDSHPWQWNGLLLAVPKHRRTNQIRRTRRRAVEKLYTRTNDIVTCETCGHHRKIGFLCSNCLTRIREETYAIKASMESSWEENNKDKMQDKENVILYEGEAPDGDDGDRNFVEMKKKRPSWFQRDLLS